MATKLRTLNDVIGQTNIVNWFRSCLKRDKIPAVTMLQGPAGIGKTSIAKIVACELACATTPSVVEATKIAVIDKSENTDAVKLYNMSNLKSQDAVSEVKSDLTVGFSSTGRKVIIMDEAHGMSSEAQDSLLTTFEALPANVYVIVCTTELASFRDAFLSRCVIRRLTNLSSSEMREFLLRRIDENNLKFSLSAQTVITLISNYTGREPRRAINLLDSFEPGSTVSVEELETFFNVYEGNQIVALIDYLYAGDILHGIDFIEEFDIGSTFQQSLIEVLRVAEQGNNGLLNKNAVMHVRELTNQNGIDRLLGFVTECMLNKPTRSALQGAFLKWCAKADIIYNQSETKNPEDVRLQDLHLMQSMIEDHTTEVNNLNDKTISVEAKTLDMLMADGDLVVSE